MKNQVLDDLFLNDIDLVPNEKIIWEGHPNFKLKLLNPFRGSEDAESIISSIVGLLLVGFFFLLTLVPLIAFLIFGELKVSLTIFGIFFLLSANRILVYISRRNTKYTITNRRIIFQLWEISRRTVQYQIPLLEINNIVITEETKNHGVIFLGLKNPSLFFFETKNLINGDHRHQITLELIDDVQQVGKYIELGIQEKL